MCVCVRVEKHSSAEKDSWADRLSKHQIRCWRTVSAEGLQGKGSRKGMIADVDVDVDTNIIALW